MGEIISINGVENLDAYMRKKINLDIYLMPPEKIYLRWKIDLNVKAKMIKLPEET